MLEKHKEPVFHCDSLMSDQRFLTIHLLILLLVAKHAEVNISLHTSGGEKDQQYLKYIQQ